MKWHLAAACCWPQYCWPHRLLIAATAPLLSFDLLCSQQEDGSFALEDEAGSVAIDLSGAQTAAGLVTGELSTQQRTTVLVSYDHCTKIRVGMFPVVVCVPRLQLSLLPSSP